MQRSFAQKLSRQSAAEVRKQISTSSKGSQDLPRAINLNQSMPSITSLWEIADPVDFEEYLAQNISFYDRDPLRKFLEFPSDDIEIKVIPRKCRTVNLLLPDHKSEIDPRIHDCLENYTSDWIVVNRKYHDQNYKNKEIEFTTPSRQEFEVEVDDDCKSLYDVEFESDKDSTVSSVRSSYTSDTPRGSWASSVFDLRNSLSDPMIVGLLDKISAETIDSRNEQKRQESRMTSLFSHFPNTNVLDDNVEHRNPPFCPTEHMGHRILVECLQLKFELEVEPIFASMALYDAKERKKISENFYFDMNPDTLKHMLSQHVSSQDTSSLSRACIFDITYPSSDIYLVIRLEKVLQGDINECAEPYIKEDKVNKEKIKSNAVMYCERLGKYRMPFAWTAVDLNVVCEKNEVPEKDIPSSNSLERKLSSASFDQLRKKLPGDSCSLSRKGSLERKEKRRSWSPEEFYHNLDSFEPRAIKISSFFKQEADKLRDEDLYKFLPELKKPSSISKKLKCIPGILKLDFSPCPDGLKYCLTPELEKVYPYPDAKKRPTKEVLEFPLKEVYFPHYVFRNLLFVYLKDLNFTNRAGSSRNITVKVQFMGGEEQQHALPVIMGKSSCPEYTTYAHTTVSYHNKTPDFYDEVKIKLPSVLEFHHHLFFTFYHISCQRKVEQTPIETPIGYTWLPLLQNGQMKVGNFQLPVMLDPPPSNYSYISPETALPGTRWVDNHKGLFSITLEAVSSIHSQDNHLENFLNLCAMIDKGKVSPHIGECNIEPEFKTRISKLTESSLEKLVKFLPLILNKLISLLIKPPTFSGHNFNIGQVCFEAIGSIVKLIVNNLENMNDHHRRNSLLTTYIHFQCKFLHLPVISADLASVSTSNLKDGDYSHGGILKSSKHYSKSTSNPDLTATLSQMDYEINSILSRGIDRTASMRTAEDHSEGNESSHCVIGKSANRKSFHEELALQWVVSSGLAKECAYINAWFFFELMFKSMVEYLAVTQKINAPRKSRFSEQFCDDITNLVTSITSEITTYFDRDNRESLFIQNLNTNLAFFLSDLLCIMDRTYVLSLIKTYCKEMTMKMSYVQDSSLIYHLKLDFFKILCNHEHFITLNLPFGTPLSCESTCVSPSPSVGSGNSQSSFVSTLLPTEKWNFAELSYDFRHQHFLLGLVLGDLSSVLDMTHPSLHMKSVNTIRLLLSGHDSNPSHQNPTVKSRIALLYLPLIGIVLDSLPQLYDWSAEGKGRLITNHEEDKSRLHQSVALAIAGTSMFGTQENLSEQSGSSSQNQNKHPLGSQTTRTLLVCFLWVIKNVDKAILQQWWLDLMPQRLHQLLEVLYICVSAFEYKGKKASKKLVQQTFRKPADIKLKLQDIILGGQGSARNEMMMRRKDKNPPSPNIQGEKLRWRKDFTQWRQMYDFTERPKADNDHDSSLDPCLATEANMIILDALEIITHVSAQSDNLQCLLGPTLKVLLHALGCNQSTTVLQNMFATQRMIVYKFPNLLFDEETEQCGDLCLRLLKHCSSSISSVRSQASASLYVLMRQNFEIGNNFSKVKMQVTTSLSSLVGTAKNFNDEFLRRSLKTILTYAEFDTEFQDTTFPEQVRDLVFNLHMILSDTVKMKEYQKDPEMLLDLMYRIAKGYQNSPDLRLTWLSNMAKKHSESNNHMEAGMCLIHSAALVSEYLHMIEDRLYLPIGAVSFQKVSPNTLEESAVSDDVISPDEETICTGMYFSEAGLLGLLEQAANCFVQAGMYEVTNEVYKTLLPIVEEHRNYKKIANIHSKLSDAFTKIDQLHGKRVFGTYFRVGFYGSMFGDLDGEEFIYKEPMLTKLSEISSRLESFYSKCFGEDRLSIIKDSNPVSKATLNPDTAYIQITYVEPYFDLWELRERVTGFERNFNIKHFIYSTPFTPDGKAHGELHEQYKRKTILTTANHFPYIKTRIQVVNRRSMVLSPIEVAIEDIQKKTLELHCATQQDPADPKILQMVLQGCIGTTVNQGPMEVALVFLSDLKEGKKTPSKHQNKLRLCFKDFSKKCADALQKNKSLIGPDQKEYQKELQRNYHLFTDKLMPMITNNHIIRFSHSNRIENEKKKTSPVI